MASAATLALPATAAAAAPRITTIAGDSCDRTATNFGDGGPAAGACFYHPYRVRIAQDGSLLIADSGNNRIRRVRPDGVVTTVAGSGASGINPANFAGDGGTATSALLSAPLDAQPLAGGGFLIADHLNHRVRRVDANGRIDTVAGGGWGASGCQAKRAMLDSPAAVAPTADGGYLLADAAGAARVWRVDSGGTIADVAGPMNGIDESRAVNASLTGASDVSPLPDGGFLIADSGNNRVLRVTPDGALETVAGDGHAGFAGDGGGATQAKLDHPTGVAASSDGGFVIADSNNHRVRYVSASGTIVTIAGSGPAGAGSGADAGDGGPATSARLNEPSGVALVPGGGVLVADSFNNVIREVESPLQPAAAAPFGAGIGSRLAIFCDGLDPAFGDRGATVLPPADTMVSKTRPALAVEGDGKLIVARSTGVERLTADGRPDPSFGSGGYAALTVGTSSFTATSLAAQPDGKIVVGGAGEDGASVLRLTTDGAVDSSFGDGGRRVVALGSYGTGRAVGVTVAPDGKIVVATTTNDHSPANPWYLLRLDPGGGLDSSFGNGGVAGGDVSGAASGLVLQPDGRIVIGGTDGYSSFQLARYTASGQLDLSFASGGSVKAYADAWLGDAPSPPTLQSDGKILLAGGGQSPYRALVGRFAADGSLDAGFGSHGIASFQAQPDPPNAKLGAPAAGSSVAVVPDGKIVVGAVGSDGTGAVTNALIAACLLPDGTLDTSFSDGGRLETAVGDGGPGPALAIDHDGRVVMTGWSVWAGTNHVVVLRYLTSGEPATAGAASGASGAVAGTAVAASPFGASASGGRTLHRRRALVRAFALRRGRHALRITLRCSRACGASATLRHGRGRPLAHARRRRRSAGALTIDLPLGGRAARAAGASAVRLLVVVDSGRERIVIERALKLR